MLEQLIGDILNLQGITINWGGICKATLEQPSVPLRGWSDLCQLFKSYDLNALPYGSATSPIAAALATQGYFAQARLVDLILNQNSILFGLAPLLYLLAGIGGLIMLALGAPPKLYLWFILGPALYHIVLGKRVESSGNLWMVGQRLMPQNEVERLKKIDTGSEFSVSLNLGSNSSTSTPLITWGQNPGKANVPLLFAMVDAVTSSAVQGITSAFTPSFSIERTTAGQTNTGGQNNPDTEEPWYILSDQKWDLLETITSARLSNADIRDLFTTFLTSECGDVLKRNVNYALYFSARNSKNSTPLTSVMYNVQNFTDQLASQTTPMPRSIRSLLQGVYRRDSPTSNSQSVDMDFSFQFATLGLTGDSVIINRIFNSPEISCNTLLTIISASIRAEAGYAFANLMSKAPLFVPTFGNPNGGLGDFVFRVLLGDIQPMTPHTLFRTMFGTWKGLEDKLASPTSFSLGNNLHLNIWNSFFNNGLSNNPIFSALHRGENVEASKIFIDLITAYIFKNELAFAPALFIQKGSNPDETVEAGLKNISSVGSRSKFAEVYVWAKMLPNVQGLFLYWLALGFPIAVIIMILPNFHKALITWALFWIWVKSWDVGFVLIKRVERTLWSMVGNSDYLSAQFEAVSGFSALSRVIVGCFDAATGAPQTMPPCPPGTVPVSFVRTGVNPNPPGYSTVNSLSSGINFEESARIFDLGLSLSNTFNLEEGNAFYIYLMAAMYFAVPVIMGQLILGSKAAMANLVKDFIGQPTQDAARSAGSAYSAQRQAQASATSATFNQQEMLKNMRADGLAARAIATQNLGLANKFDSALSQQIATGIESKAGMMDLGMQRLKANLDAIKTANLLHFNLSTAMAGRDQNPLGALAALAILRHSISSRGALNITDDELSRIGNDSMNRAFQGVDYVAWTLRRQYELAAQMFSNDQQGNQEQGVASNGAAGLNTPSAQTTTHQRVQFSPQASHNRANGQTAPQTPPDSVGAFYNPNQGVSNNMPIAIPGADGNITTIAQNGLNSILSPAYYGTIQGITSMFDAASTVVQPPYLDTKARLTATSRGWGVNSFELGQLAGGYDEEARRLQAATQFSAQDSTWLARADYANSVSATLAAYGVSPTTVSPGEKPTDMMGGAWLGQLGTSAALEAKFVDSQETSRFTFFSQVVEQSQALKFNYGTDALQASFDNIAQAAPQSLVGLAILNSGRRMSYEPNQGLEAFAKARFSTTGIVRAPEGSNFSTGP